LELLLIFSRLLSFPEIPLFFSSAFFVVCAYDLINA